MSKASLELLIRNISTLIVAAKTLPGSATCNAWVISRILKGSIGSPLVAIKNRTTTLAKESNRAGLERELESASVCIQLVLCWFRSWSIPSFIKGPAQFLKHENNQFIAHIELCSKIRRNLSEGNSVNLSFITECAETVRLRHQR